MNTTWESSWPYLVGPPWELQAFRLGRRAVDCGGSWLQCPHVVFLRGQ